LPELTLHITYCLSSWDMTFVLTCYLFTSFVILCFVIASVKATGRAQLETGRAGLGLIFLERQRAGPGLS